MASKGGAVFLMLFGSVFLAVGVVMCVLSLRTLRRAEAVKQWRETPARIVSCDLQTSRGSKGGYTYEARATYQYDVGGSTYTSERVSLHSGSDNVGDFQQRTYEMLKRSRGGVEDTVCWVNPANPADAILIRKPRLEMLVFMQLFVLAFGGVGLGIFLSALNALLKPSAQATSATGQGLIRMRGTSAHRVAGAFAVIWNGYVGWFLWQSYQAFAPEPLPWWLWLMALAGAIPIAVAGYLIGRHRKFGVSVFEMSPLPGVLGGPVNGTIRIPAKVETAEGFDVTLQCVHQYTSRSGKNSTTHRDVLWEEARHIDGNVAYGDETMLPVRFAVPYERPATTVAGGSNGYYWQLKATAAAPGIDYKAVFDVPVRHTPQSRPSPELATLSQPGQTRVSSAEPVAEVIARERLLLERRADGGIELVFPAGRQRSAAAFMAVFAALWTAVCVALWMFAKAPAGMLLIFTLSDAAILFFLFNVLFAVRGIDVDRARRACVVWWRAAGLPRRERTVPFGAVLDFRSESAGQTGSTPYYRVVLLVDGGSPVTVGSGLKMWADAERVADVVRSAVTPGFDPAGFGA